MEESGPEPEPKPMPEPMPRAPSTREGAPKGFGAGVVVVIAIVLFAAGFAGGFFTAPLFQPGPQQLRLATVLDKTGGLSAFGPNNEKGALLALEQINQAGGAFGVPILGFHEDSATDPATARDAASKVVTTNEVDGIVGSTGSGQCLTVLEIAKANDVFEISGSCTTPLLSDQTLTGGWFARTAPSDALQGVIAGYYAYETAAFRNMAVVGINNPYGTGLADVFENTFEALGGTITKKQIVTETTQGATSYISDLDAIFATTIEAVYLVAYPPDGVLMYEEYLTGAYADVTWIFSEGLLSQSDFVDELDDRGVDISVLIGTAPGAYVGLAGPRFDTWADVYEARWGHPPGLFDDNVYDGTFLLALAAQASGEASGAGIKSKIMDVANPPGTVILPGEWKKALDELAAGRDINYEGASGTTDLDENGDPVISQYAVWGIDTDGKITNLIEYDEAEVAAIVAGIAGAPPFRSPFAVGWIAPFWRD